jgi:hypothetical protein
MKQRMRERETPHGITQCGDIETLSKLDHGQTGMASLATCGHEVLQREKKGIASRERNLRRSIYREGAH